MSMMTMKEDIMYRLQSGLGHGNDSSRKRSQRLTLTFISPVEIEEWVDETRQGMENALRVNHILYIREQ